MAKSELDIMRMKRELLKMDIEIAEKENESANQKQPVRDNYGFEVVQSGSGYAVIMPNGIRLSKSKCIPYKSITVYENGDIMSSKSKCPLSINEIQKFYGIIDTFPNKGKDRAVWCDENFGGQFSFEVIIYNLFIGTFNEYIKEPIVIVGE